MSLDQVNKAFSNQSGHYDNEDASNIVLQYMRQQVYAHVDQYIKPKSNILELNAGTGIDAFRFASKGHRVHATDLSTGMVHQISLKVNADPQSAVTFQQLSYDQLDRVSKSGFDYVFSNFGGLNCIKDLSTVTKHLPQLLHQGAFVTFVIMPPVCLWEYLWILKGEFRKAVRRLNRDGVMAHLEGEYFKTYYHSLSAIRKAFPPSFTFIRTEGLCGVSPPPQAINFVGKNLSTYKLLRSIDKKLINTFPFDRWADHIIVTFRYNKPE